ncbi:hypothetical protein P9112_006606 [Eukaryota sp. TZLM1-RC]
MPVSVKCFAAFEEKGKLQPHIISLPSTQQELPCCHVLLEVISCSLCHSDVHLVDNDWGISKYPLVPGHEIVGKVIEIGHGSTVQKGDICGVGWLSNSCGSCQFCRIGEEQLCSQAQPTILPPSYGGLAEKVVAHERLCYNLNNFGSNVGDVAPLLCAGATVWSPLSKHLRPGLRVGVIGLGGLGSVAIQLAKHLGHKVTLLTRSMSKKEEAWKLGASTVIDMTDETSYSPAQGSLDLMLNTASASLDWERYLSMLSIGGTVVLLGLPADSTIVLNGMNVVTKSLTLTGSTIAGTSKMTELLHFAKINAVMPPVEIVHMNNASEALERLRSGVKHRLLLKW